MKSKVVIIVECGIVSRVTVSPPLKNEIELIVQDYDVLDENAVNVVYDMSGDACSLHPVEDINVLTVQEDEWIEQSLKSE